MTTTLSVFLYFKAVWVFASKVNYFKFLEDKQQAVKAIMRSRKRIINKLFVKNFVNNICVPVRAE